ncbi:MAG: type II secretion system F family protein [Patescibacteria group bacterium]|nr:type II secretion system F family protein [Patescibacteria group bacterium]
MAIFDYRAKDREGNNVTGVIEAPTENVAAELLEDRKYIILTLIQRKKATIFQGSIGMLNRVPLREVVIFSRQLSVMIATAVPIVQALRILVKQTRNVTFKIIISEIADEVDGGAKLSTSLSRYPQVFSEFFVHMIRSGETTGKLDETLIYLADQLEKDYDLQSKIRGAMIYPAFIMTALVAVGLVMMIFVIPKLTAVLEESGAELPITTRILIWTSNFLKNDWWVLILAIIGIVFLYRLISRSEAGRRQIDYLKLHLPVFGNLFQKIYLTRFARSISTLIAGGIPLTRTLEIVADIVGNTVYRELTIDTISVIEDGNSIATLFAKSKDVPPMLTQMMAVGEQTGKLDMILRKLSEFYAKEVETMVHNIVTLLEPMVMLLLGAAVAVMITAILLPMYQLSSTI